MLMLPLDAPVGVTKPVTGPQIVTADGAPAAALVGLTATVGCTVGWMGPTVTPAVGGTAVGCTVGTGTVGTGTVGTGIVGSGTVGSGTVGSSGPTCVDAACAPLVTNALSATRSMSVKASAA
jgi:hypothetical protein